MMTAIYLRLDMELAGAMARLDRLVRDRSGATAGEYALLASGLAISIIVGLGMIGDSVVDLLTIPTEVFSSAGP